MALSLAGNPTSTIVILGATTGKTLSVGNAVGIPEGSNEGATEGSCDGEPEGLGVGGSGVGIIEGLTVG